MLIEEADERQKPSFFGMSRNRDHARAYTHSSKMALDQLVAFLRDEPIVSSQNLFVLPVHHLVQRVLVFWSSDDSTVKGMHALLSANTTKGITFFRHKVLSDFTIAKQDVTIQIHVENSKTTTHLPTATLSTDQSNRSPGFWNFQLTNTTTWLWRWLPHRLSKRQSLTTVVLRTPITQIIFFNHGTVFLWDDYWPLSLSCESDL